MSKQSGKESLSERLQIRLSPTEKTRLEQLSMKEGLSLSKFIRNLLLREAEHNSAMEKGGQKVPRTVEGIRYPPVIHEDQCIVIDELLKRRVGIHVLNSLDPKKMETFQHEARTLARLDHPTIPMVYDMGYLPDGRFYYTNKALGPELETLAQRLASWSIQPSIPVERRLLRSLDILQQVCRGVDSMHMDGKFHGNLQPEAILLDELDMVTLSSFDFSPSPTHPPFHPYVSPERLQGALPTEKSDQYSIGAILAWVLTGRPPFEERGAYEMVKDIVDTELELEVTPEFSFLADLCYRAMAKEPSQRFASCKELLDGLMTFQDRLLREKILKQERARAAEELFTEAHQVAATLPQVREQVQHTYHLYRKCEDATKRYAEFHSKDKQTLWNTEEEFLQAQKSYVTCYTKAIDLYSRALDEDPTHKEARHELGELYEVLYLEAEQARDIPRQHLFLEKIQQYDSERYSQLRASRNPVSFHMPKGTLVELYRYEEEKRRLLPVLLDSFSTVDGFFQKELPTGSYVLHLQKSGFRELRYPFWLRRGSALDETIHMFSQSDVPDGFVHVPAGRFPFGGDLDAQMSLPYSEKEEEDFFISKYPITFRDYIAFLNELRSENPEEALSMEPRGTDRREEVYVRFVEQEGYIPDRLAIFGEDFEQQKVTLEDALQVPVFGVSWYDAIRYCRWRSQNENRLYTLPTEEQWEKAAGGVDHRRFPWGYSFDAAFCKMGWSRKIHQPEPIGSFPIDESPFGVCDVVGTVSEWVRSGYLPHRLDELDAIDALTHDPIAQQVQRGGGWAAAYVNAMHIGTRNIRSDGSCSYNSGFRLVTFPIQKTGR